MPHLTDYPLDPIYPIPSKSNAKALWVHPPMRDEEMLVEQCALLKAINPEIKCFVYRNLNKVGLNLSLLPCLFLCLSPYLPSFSSFFLFIPYPPLCLINKLFAFVKALPCE